MQRFNNLNLRTTQDYVVASAPGQVDLQECSQRFHWGTFMASSSITNRRIEELTQAGRDILADAESKSRPFIGNIDPDGLDITDERPALSRCRVQEQAVHR